MCSMMLTEIQTMQTENTDIDILPRKEFSDERLQFNNLLDSWLKSYREIYPFLSARVHVPGGVPCPYCQTYYKSFHLLRRHWGRIHDPGAPLLTCSLCEYKTNQKGLLDSHVKHIHCKGMRKEYPCDKCSKIYQSSSRLMKHKLLHHVDKSNLILYKCDKCNFSSFDTTNLKRHIERKHLDIDRRYLCIYCGRLSKTKFAMERHEMEHLGTVLTFNCKLCSESFDHKLDLFSHQQIVHSPYPVYFNCNFCEFKTLNKEMLVVHDNVTHRSVKHFKCSECSSTLKDMVSLATHITRKHNPYISWKYCAHCSYKSLKKAAVASHVLKHLPRKSAPIKCKLCKYRTYKPYYYKRHFNVRHNPDAIYYHCYHCNYANKVKAKLHQHIQEKGHLLK